MAGAVAELLNVGNSVADIAALANQDVSKVGRLQTLASGRGKEGCAGEQARCGA